jgi:hypothetical protein
MWAQGQIGHVGQDSIPRAERSKRCRACRHKCQRRCVTAQKAYRKLRLGLGGEKAPAMLQIILIGIAVSGALGLLLLSAVGRDRLTPEMWPDRTTSQPLATIDPEEQRLQHSVARGPTVSDRKGRPHGPGGLAGGSRGASEV